MNFKNPLHCCLIVLTIINGFASCKKDRANIVNKKTSVVTQPGTQRMGVYILNTTLGTPIDVPPENVLGYYDFDSLKFNPAISLVSNNTLGSEASDINLYGSKIYITDISTKTIEVLDSKTAVSVARVQLPYNGSTSTPWEIIPYKNYMLISASGSGIAMLDTTSLTVSQYINLNTNTTSGMVVANNKLYALTDIGKYPDSSYLSVIDLNTLNVIKRINVFTCPVDIGADAYGNVYVRSSGMIKLPQYNYGAGTVVIDSKTDDITMQDEKYYYKMTVGDKYVYYVTNKSKVIVFDAKTYKRLYINPIADFPEITLPDLLKINRATGDLYIGSNSFYPSEPINNPSPNLLLVLDKNGKKVAELNAEASHIAFLNK